MTVHRDDDESSRKAESVDEVVLYAEFTARKGAAEQVAALVRDYAAAVRQEPGNVVFDGYRRHEASDRFFIFEVYRDRSAFDAHLAAPYGSPFNAALGPLIVEDASELSFLRRVEAT
jgi:quinol monooxygenase YgiN